MEHLDHPSPHFNDGKMARFRTFAPSSLLLGGEGVNWSFLFCPRLQHIGHVVLFPKSISALVNFNLIIIPVLYLPPYVATSVSVCSREKGKSCIQKFLFFNSLLFLGGFLQCSFIHDFDLNMLSVTAQVTHMSIYIPCVYHECCE